MARLEVNDVFDELREENRRLSQLVSMVYRLSKLLDQFRDSLSDACQRCQCEHNPKTKQSFDVLHAQYQTLSGQLSVALKAQPSHSLSAATIGGNYVRKQINYVKRNQVKDNIKDVKDIKEIKEVKDVKDIKNVEEVLKREETDKKLDASSDYSLGGHSDGGNDPWWWWSSVGKDETGDQKVEESKPQPIDTSLFLTSDSEFSRTVQSRPSGQHKRLVCNFADCDFQCLREEKMNNHIRELHHNRTPLNCPDCGAVCWGKHQMGKHVIKTHPEHYDPILQKFICVFAGCNLKFPRYSALELHRRRHTGEKLYKCSKDYPDCVWTFFTPAELRNHQVNSHFKGSEWNCDWVGCGQGFKTKTDLDLHKLHNHCESETKSMELLETVDDSFNSHIPDRTFLKSEFQTNYSAVRYSKSNKIRFFICNYSHCEFKCSLKEKIEKHVTDQHLNRTPIKCFECNQSFWTQKTVSNHVRVQHPTLWDQSGQRFICNYGNCSLGFDRYSKLLVHRNRHIGEKSFKCSKEYPGCNWCFFTLGELKNHQVWSHSEDYPFQCDWQGCERRFKLKNLLVDHQKTHNPETMPFQCDWPGCEMRFVRRYQLKVHQSSHIGDRSFICDWPECGQAFRTAGNLRVHYAIHTGDKRFRCEWPGCEMRFITSTGLHRHKVSHQTGPGEHLCEWPDCNKRFRQRTSLKLHLMSHRGDRPFQCMNCDKRFLDKKHLNKHFKRVHLKDHKR